MTPFTSTHPNAISKIVEAVLENSMSIRGLISAHEPVRREVAARLPVSCDVRARLRRDRRAWRATVVVAACLDAADAGHVFQRFASGDASSAEVRERFVAAHALASEVGVFRRLRRWPEFFAQAMEAIGQPLPDYWSVDGYRWREAAKVATRALDESLRPAHVFKVWPILEDVSSAVVREITRIAYDEDRSVFPLSSSEWAGLDGQMVAVSVLDPSDRPEADPRFVFEPAEIREIAAMVLEEQLAKGQSMAQRWLDSKAGKAVVTTIAA